MLEQPEELKNWKREILDEMKFYLSRRELLRAAVVGGAALSLPWLVGRGLSVASAAAAEGTAGKASSAVKTGTFFFPRLMFKVKDETPNIWDIYPAADIRLRKRVSELTNVNVSQDPVVVKLSDLDNMSRYPFVFATSEGYFDIPANEEKNLKEFLSRGGFVHADDCVHPAGKHQDLPSDLKDDTFKPRAANRAIDGDRFFYDMLTMLHKLFPDNAIRRIPLDHEIYHCYFDFPKGSPHLQGVNHGGWGLIEKDTERIMSFVTPGDLHCGWTGQFFTKPENEMAMRMGVNIIIYYLTH